MLYRWLDFLVAMSPWVGGRFKESVGGAGSDRSGEIVQGVPQCGKGYGHFQGGGLGGGTGAVSFQLSQLPWWGWWGGISSFFRRRDLLFGLFLVHRCGVLLLLEDCHAIAGSSGVEDRTSTLMCQLGNDLVPDSTWQTQTDSAKDPFKVHA